MRFNGNLKALAIAAAMAATALADGGGGNNGGFSSSVVGSTPNLTLGGVASGSSPWTVSQSSASLSASGQGQAQLQVQTQNLVIASGSGVGTTGSVREVAASVVCGGGGGMVVASTAGFPFMSGGNAQIQATVNIPATCRAPIVLVRVFSPSNPQGSQLGPFIASTGLSSRSTNGNSGADDNPDDQDH